MSQRAAKLKYLKAKAQKSAPLQSKPSKPILPPIQADDTESDTDGSSTGDLNSQSEEESRGDGEDTEEGADEDDDGVDDEGMERLMNALGDDGLDDFALAQLAGEVESEGDDGETGSEGSGSGKEEDNASEAGSEEDGRGGSEDEEDETGEARDEQSNHKPKPKANPNALLRIREAIQLDPSFPWTETLVTVYPESLQSVDPNDDLNRELAFYKQALHSAQESRKLADKHSLPFTRPSDYFAEMVKDDIHMERIRTKLLDEAAAIKKSEEAKKQRQAKKFGKQVQVEKAKERTKAKKEMMNKVDNLKRKRSGGMDDLRDDDFEIALDEKLDDRPNKRATPNNRGRGRGRGGSNLNRAARDKKYHWGSGGPSGRHAKSNTRESTDDFGGGKRGVRGARGGGRGGPNRPQKRLGKSRRK